MSKRKLQLVPDNVMPPISDLSPGEEARVLRLADIALQNPESTNAFGRAGSRARADHRRLIEELEREAVKIRRRKRAA